MKQADNARPLQRLVSPRLGAGMFSSATDEWSTPTAFFAAQNAKFAFTLDSCATAENAKCQRFFDRAADGLAQSWAGERVWMNPPYGREIGKWMRKAHEESKRGALVVCLVPARTDTAWWHDYAAKGRVEFIRGRLKFGSAKHNAPFPVAVVVFERTNRCILSPASDSDGMAMKTDTKDNHHVGGDAR